jgi:hypothetical protein
MATKPADEDAPAADVPEAWPTGLVIAELVVLVAAEPVLDAELPQLARMPARTVSRTVRPSLLPLMPPGMHARLDRHNFHSRPITSTNPTKVDHLHVSSYSQ